VRQGCGCGCLTVVVAVILVLGGIWYGRGLFDRAPAPYEAGNAADGRRAQQKLFELSVGRGQRRDAKPVTVTLLEREINALVARHVADALPLGDASVHLAGDGVIEVAGRLPLRMLLGDSLSAAARSLPRQWAEQPVWIRLRGPLRLEAPAARGGPRRLRLEVQSAWFGARRVPAALLGVLPQGPLQRATRWPVSGAVESVVVEPGRLTVTSRP
jgi:hypothetical protein